MNKECEIVRDLLPLYAENMASEASRLLVEKHLASCAECRMALDKEKGPLEISPQTDVQAFRRVKKALWKRTVCPVLLVVFLALNLFCGVLVCSLVPVMADYEEAVARVEQTSEGVRVYLKDEASGIVNINNGFYLQKRRLDWFYPEELKRLRSEKEHFWDLHIPEGGSAWYIGEPTGSPDTLVWGDGKEAPDAGFTDRMDRTLCYVFWVCLAGAVLMLALWALVRKKRVAKVLLHAGIMLACCSICCLFVTEGHLLERAVRTGMLSYEPMLQKQIAIGVMTVLSYLCCLFGIQTVRVFKKTK